MKYIVLLAWCFAALPAQAGAKHERNYYGSSMDDFVVASDRWQYPRSVEQYRHIVGPNVDVYGFCRSAEHLRQCLRHLKSSEEKTE